MLTVNISIKPSSIQVGNNTPVKISYFSYLNSYIKSGAYDGDRVINLPEQYVVYIDGKLRWSKNFLTAKKKL